MGTVSRLVPRFETTAALVRATNEVRERVVRALAEYLELVARMRQFEDAFSTQVLHSAQHLHDITAQRKRLAAELARITGRIDRGGYESAGQIEDDVRAVLTAAQVDAAEVAAHPAAPADVADGPGEDDDGLDEVTRRRIVRDFKRIVLPAVHADTSDTAFPVFDMAYSAYRARDHVLMEALVIQYRGEVGAADDEGRPLLQEQVAARLHDYRAAARRLDARLRAVRQDITEDELSNPERTRQRMARWHEELRQAIDEEAERVLELRRRLETLVDGGHDDDEDGVLRTQGDADE